MFMLPISEIREVGERQGEKSLLQYQLETELVSKQRRQKNGKESLFKEA